MIVQWLLHCGKAFHLIFLILLIDQLIAQRPNVVTTTGPVQGQSKTHIIDDQAYIVDTFLGIPYAQPPIDYLRFRAPQPVKPWQRTLVSTVRPPSCHQPLDTMFGHAGAKMWNANTEMSEDCLYLNVWAPKNANRLAVMVWIYGGAFSAGTATLDIYDGSVLAATQQVVVASMNYRLGPLGFLYLNTPEAPGNVGLLDQQLALRWIKANAARFGGDPDKITIFGESAGAASVGYHLLSPGSWDHFTYAILESASAFVPWGIRPRNTALGQSYKFAHHANCLSHNGTDGKGRLRSLSATEKRTMVYCLRMADPQDLTFTQYSLVRRYFEVPIPVVVDNDFLPSRPTRSFETRTIKQTNILVGSNKDEGSYFLLYGFANQFKLRLGPPLMQSEFHNMVRQMFRHTHGPMVIESIIFQYDRLRYAKPSYRDILDDVNASSFLRFFFLTSKSKPPQAGDYEFICPVMRFAAEYAAANHQVFMYHFQHRSQFLPWPPWMGTPHGYEIEYVFGVPLLDRTPFRLNYTETDRQVARKVMRFFSNFAKTGNPNRHSEEQMTNLDWEWPEYTSVNKQNIVFDTLQRYPIEEGRRHAECTFWNEYVPQLAAWETANSGLLF